MSSLPLSPALAEADPESLSDFLSRSPESLTPADLMRTVAILREQRARWAAAEGQPKAPKAPKAAPKPQAKKASAVPPAEPPSTLEDLGL